MMPVPATYIIPGEAPPSWQSAARAAGWVSAEEHAKVQAEAAAMRDMVNQLRCLWCRRGEPRTDCHSGTPAEYHGYAYRHCTSPEASALLESSAAGLPFLALRDAAAKVNAVEDAYQEWKRDPERNHGPDPLLNGKPIRVTRDAALADLFAKLEACK